MPDKYTQYLLQHRESIARLITQHGANLPATTEADAACVLGSFLSVADWVVLTLRFAG